MSTVNMMKGPPSESVSADSAPEEVREKEKEREHVPGRERERDDGWMDSHQVLHSVAAPIVCQNCEVFKSEKTMYLNLEF